MKKTNASFRFVSDDLDPDRATDLMKIKPSDAHAKGVAPPEHPERRYPTGVWRIESPISPMEPLDAHLNALLDLLEPHTAAVRQLQAEGWKADFFCGLFYYTSISGNIELDAPMLSRLARFGASLGICTYDMNDDDVPGGEPSQDA